MTFKLICIRACVCVRGSYIAHSTNAYDGIVKSNALFGSAYIDTDVCLLNNCVKRHLRFHRRIKLSVKCNSEIELNWNSENWKWKLCGKLIGIQKSSLSDARKFRFVSNALICWRLRWHLRVIIWNDAILSSFSSINDYYYFPFKEINTIAPILLLLPLFPGSEANLPGSLSNEPIISTKFLSQSTIIIIIFSINIENESKFQLKARQTCKKHTITHTKWWPFEKLSMHTNLFCNFFLQTSSDLIKYIFIFIIS